ncbi:MAG: OmpA family protein [candidate division Zixibacteria bacterium]|nr:OmpA family protein [candidate division Zixibacteria bacterium]
MLFQRNKSAFEDNENLDRWLLTYADLITLLLAFFVILYSMSRVDAGKFNNISGALSGVFKGDEELGKKFTEQLSSKLVVNKLLKRGNLIVLKDQVDKISQQFKLGSIINTEIQTRGLVIHLSESAFYDPGKADLKQDAKKILDLLSVQLLKIPNHIRVEGHTDNLPIHTARFPSNWELSTTRATNCLRYFLEKYPFPAARISALGYAEYRPITNNDTAEGRAKNRRVDIIILNIEDSYIEPENLTGEPVNTLPDTTLDGNSDSNTKTAGA